jgi:hypothetical protein
MTFSLLKIGGRLWQTLAESSMLKWFFTEWNHDEHQGLA